MKENANILIIDDDEAVLTTARMFLKQKFSYVHGLSSPNNLDSVLNEVDFDLVLLDMNFTKGEDDGLEGLALLDRILQLSPSTEVIPITAYGEVELVVEAMRRGARDFITKPWTNDKLLSAVQTAMKMVESQKTTKSPETDDGESQGAQEQIIGDSRAFKQVLQTISKVAATDASVLLLGENGTGKEVAAKAIHQQSERKEGPFVKIDLGALSPSLFESELFGHKKGAFTDAREDKAGKFEMAQGGTLFLDEIGNLELPLQTKLLSALQNREITRVGSNTAVPIDVRLISATNSDLRERVGDGTFRQDLLYRINTIEISMPPLRERTEDIPLLVQHYFQEHKKQYKKRHLKLEKECMEALQRYPWPGNIRELAHATERAVIMAEGTLVTMADFHLLETGATEESLDLRDHEKRLILKALERNKGNITHAAKDLGIDRLALYRRLEKYGL